MNPKIVLPCLVLLLSLRAIGFASPADVGNAKPVSKHAEKQETESATTATIKVYVEDVGETCTLPAPPKGFQFSWTKISPKRDIMITEYSRLRNWDENKPWDQDNDKCEIWLSLRSDPSKKELLISHWRIAEVLMSDDEKWIIINNKFASDNSVPMLCRHAKGIDYKFVRDIADVSIGKRAWQFFEKEHHLKVPLDYGHEYVDAIRWGSNSHTVLLQIQGHEDESHYLDPWFCVLNVETLALTLDLRELNMGAFPHPIKKRK